MNAEYLAGSCSRQLDRRVATRLASAFTSATVVRTYNKEVQRQKILVKKARLCETRLTFIQTALGDLLRDDNFVNLLRAEGLETMPKNLRDRVRAAGAR
jgi:ParB family chromosome partitioning protein